LLVPKNPRICARPWKKIWEGLPRLKLSYDPTALIGLCNHYFLSTLREMMMRKPRDFDANLKGPEDKAYWLKTRKVRQLGELSSPPEPAH